MFGGEEKGDECRCRSTVFKPQCEGENVHNDAALWCLVQGGMEATGAGFL